MSTQPDIPVTDEEEEAFKAMEQNNKKDAS